MKKRLHKNAFSFVLAGTIALTPIAANFAIAPHTAHAATDATAGIVAYHDAIYKKLTASDIADIKAAYSKVDKVDFSKVLGASLVAKIDGKTSSKGTAVAIAKDLAKLQYQTNSKDFKAALEKFRTDHKDHFTKIFDGKLSVDQAILLFADFENRLQNKLVQSFIKKDNSSFNTIVKAAANDAAKAKGVEGLFSQKLGVSLDTLLAIKANAEKATDPVKSASAGLSSGLIRSNGGDIYGSSSIYAGSSASYLFKVAILGDFTKNVQWKTTNSEIASFSGNKLTAKKAGKVKVQAYYLNMPVITKDVTISVKDTVAPAAPKVDPFDNRDKVISGKAEANSYITVKRGSTTVAKGYASSKGTFALQIERQKGGTILTFTAKDKAGNTSKTTIYKVLDKYTAAPTVYSVDNNDKVIKGKAAEGHSYITVKYGKTTIAKGYTSSNGSFSLKMKTQKAGTVLKVYAIDKAGNISVATTVTVHDKIAPAKPTVYSVDSNDKVIKGKAEKGATITIKKGSKVLATGKVTSKGNFSIKIKAQKKGTVLYVTAKDKAKNVSNKTKVVVKAAK
ncbi:Ig-like domain-containing protein [Neobacillus cucumis]|nr:Ig-like domain-containing protein [Neobacillus cucumis]